MAELDDSRTPRAASGPPSTPRRQRLGVVLRWETLLVVLLGATIAYGASVSPYFLRLDQPLLHLPERGRGRDHGAPAHADRDHRRDRPLGRVDARPHRRADGRALQARLADLAGDGRGGRPRRVPRRVQRLPGHAARPAVAGGHDRHADALPRHRAGDPADGHDRRLPARASRASASSRSRTRTSRTRSRSSLALAVIFAIVLHATPLGRAIFAIGASQEAAFFAGIRVKRIKFWLFVLSGLLSGFAGVLWTLRFASARYDSGIGLELFVVTIVLLGGVSIFGGRGTIFGVIIAVAILGCLQTALTADLIPAQDQNIVVGILLLASVIVPNARRHVPARARPAAERRGPTPAPAAQARRPVSRGDCAARRRLRHRARRVLAAVRGPARAARRLPAGPRGAARRARRRGRLGRARGHPGGARARPAIARRRTNVDLILLYTATYATSSQVLPAVQAARRRSSILNLQPTRVARLRGDDDRRVAGQLLGLLRARARGRVHPRARSRTARSPARCSTAIPPGTRSASGSTPPRPCSSLRGARLGFLGHTYPGMLDMYSDFTQIHAQTGAHVEVLEIDDLVDRVESADAAAIARKGDEIRAVFDLADAGHRPDRGRDHARGLRLVGARRRRARPARRGLRARRADVLLPRRRRATPPSGSARG